MRQNSDAIKLWTLCSRVDVDDRGKNYLFDENEKSKLYFFKNVENLCKLVLSIIMLDLFLFFIILFI